MCQYWPPPTLASRLPTQISNGLNCDPVIAGPLDVVKELLENALDAGATEITVYTRGSGLDMVGVMDNGCGLPATKEGLEDLCNRHTTSKLFYANDLLSLHSYGFRGSALSEVANWGKLKVYTRSIHSAGVPSGEGNALPLAGLPNRLRGKFQSRAPLSTPRHSQSPRIHLSTPTDIRNSDAFAALLNSVSRLSRTAEVNGPSGTPAAGEPAETLAKNGTTPATPRPVSRVRPQLGLPIISATYSSGELDQLVELDGEVASLVISRAVGEGVDASSPFSLVLLAETRFNPAACTGLGDAITQLLGTYSLAHPDKTLRLFNCDTLHQVSVFPPGIGLKHAIFRVFPYTERREKELRRLLHLGGNFILRRSARGAGGPDMGILDESAYVSPPGVLDRCVLAGKVVDLSSLLPGTEPTATPRATTLKYTGRESPTAWYDFYEPPSEDLALSRGRSRAVEPGKTVVTTKEHSTATVVGAVEEARNLANTLELAPRFQAAKGREDTFWNLAEISTEDLRLALLVATKNKSTRLSQARIDVVLSCLVEQAEGPRKSRKNSADRRPGEEAFLVFFNARPVRWESLEEVVWNLFEPDCVPPFIYIEIAQPGLYGSADPKPDKGTLSLLYDEALKDAVESLLKAYAVSRGIQREKAAVVPASQLEICSGLDECPVHTQGLPSDLRRELVERDPHTPARAFTVWFRETLEYISGDGERAWGVAPLSQEGKEITSEFGKRAKLEFAPAKEKWVIIPAREIRELQAQCVQEAITDVSACSAINLESARSIVLWEKTRLENEVGEKCDDETRFLTPEFAALHEKVSGRALTVFTGQRSRTSLFADTAERGHGSSKSWGGSEHNNVGDHLRTKSACSRTSQSSRRSHLSSMSEGLASILSRPEDPDLLYLGLVQESEQRYVFHFQAAGRWMKLDAVEELGKAFAAVLRGFVWECMPKTSVGGIQSTPGRSLDEAWAGLGDSWGQGPPRRPSRPMRQELYAFDLRRAMLIRSARNEPLFDLAVKDGLTVGPTIRAWLGVVGISRKAILHPLFPLLQDSADLALARLFFSTNRMALPSAREMTVFLQGQERVWGTPLPVGAAEAGNPLLAAPMPPGLGFVGETGAFLAGKVIRCLAGADDQRLGRALFEAIATGLTEERLLRIAQSSREAAQEGFAGSGAPSSTRKLAFEDQRADSPSGLVGCGPAVVGLDGRSARARGITFPRRARCAVPGASRLSSSSPACWPGPPGPSPSRARPTCSPAWEEARPAILRRTFPSPPSGRPRDAPPC